MNRPDVAVIGAGPVGLLLAALLGRRGVSVVVYDRQPAPYDLPRAVHFDAETMRIFQAAGVAEAVRRETIVGVGMLFKDGAGRTLIDWSRAQEIGPQGWHESYRFHQPDLERLLAASLDRFDHVRLERGAEVTDVSQDGDGVRLRFADGRVVEAGYVVGCDGASSFLRRRLGIGREDLGFRETWLVLDLLLKRPRPDLGDYSIQFCDPEAPATYVRSVGPRRRWEMRAPECAAGPPGHEEIWARLSRWIGPEDADIERAAVYEFRSAVADGWRRGRAFLAGDAAHQMPPFMGQGLCAGARDAANLAWKVAIAVKTGDDGALDSYESERTAHVLRFIELSTRLGRLINQTAAGEAPKGRMASIFPDLGPGLGPRAGVGGRLAPQPRLADGRLADDAAAGGFHILARGRAPASAPLFRAGEDWLTENGLFAALIRPDGYVLEGAETPEALAAICAAEAPLIEAAALAGFVVA